MNRRQVCDVVYQHVLFQNTQPSTEGEDPTIWTDLSLPFFDLCDNSKRLLTSLQHHHALDPLFFSEVFSGDFCINSSERSARPKNHKEDYIL